MPVAIIGAEALTIAMLVSSPGEDGRLPMRYHWTRSTDGTYQESPAVRALNDAGWEVYHAMCGYTQRTRSAENIAGVQALWADIDIAKHLAEGEDAEAANDAAILEVAQMVREHKLPTPTEIVMSGGGIHIYWHLTAPLDVPTWKVMAGKLRLPLRRTFGVRYDGQCTIDAMRLMRAPGYINHRRGRIAEAFVVGAAVDPAVMQAACEAITATPEELRAIAHTTSASAATELAVADALAKLGPRASDVPASGAFGGIERVDRPANWVLLRDLSLAGSGCNVLAKLLTTHGDCGYDLWTGAFSIAARTDDYDAAIQMIGGQWADWGTVWDTDKVKQRVGSFVGPRSCAQLGDAFRARFGEDACASCRQCGKVKSPLSIGVPGVVDTRPEPVPPAPTRVEVTAPVVSGQVNPRDLVVVGVGDPANDRNLLPPSGDFGGIRYVRIGDRWETHFVAKKDGGVETLPLLDHAVWPAGTILVPVDGQMPIRTLMWACRKDEAEGTKVFTDDKGGGGTDSAVSAFMNTMWQRGIDCLCELPMRNVQPLIRHMFNSDLTRRASMLELVNHYGTDGTPNALGAYPRFIFGNTAYYADGAAQRVRSGFENVTLTSVPTAPALHEVDDVVDAWRTHLMALCGDKQTPGNGVAQLLFASAFGGPAASMMGAAAPELGGIMLVTSSDGGHGKTSLTTLASSIYGKRRDMVRSKMTDNAFWDFAVRVGSLPVVADDVDRNFDTRRDPGGLLSFVMASTDGQNKQRTGDTASARGFRNTWITASSNKQLAVKAANDHDRSDAPMLRVFTLLYDIKGLPSKDSVVAPFSTWAEQHAGQIGHLWAYYLVQRQHELRASREKWLARLLVDVPRLIERPWRFYRTMAIGTLVGAEHAILCNLLPFDLEFIYENVRAAVIHNIAEHDNFIGERDDVINRLVTGLVGTTLMREWDRTRISIDAQRPLNRIEARNFTDIHRFAVPLNQLPGICQRLGLNPSTVYETAMRSHGGKRELLDIGMGTPWASAPTMCVSFNLGGPAAVSQENPA